MKPRALLLLALILVVASAAVWWVGIESHEPAPEAKPQAQPTLMPSPSPSPLPSAAEADGRVEVVVDAPASTESELEATSGPAPFSGRVMDLAGNPVSAVAIELRGASETKTCSSDSSGSFEVELASGNWILEARHADFERHVEVVEWIDTSRAPPHEIRLRAIRLVGVRFVGEDGNALPATLAQTRFELRPRAVAFEADDAGGTPLESAPSLKFLTKTELRGENAKNWHGGLLVPHGRVCLAQATCLGVAGPLTRIYPNDVMVQLTLPLAPIAARLANLEVRLLDAESRAPLSNQIVSFVPPEGGNRAGATDGDGRTSFAGVASGVVKLSVDAPGYAQLRRIVALEPGAEASVEYALERSQDLHGIARQEDGSPFASRGLWYFELGATREPNFRVATSSVRTDEEGRFTVWNVTSRPLIVVPDVSGTALGRSATLLKVGDANEVTVRPGQRLCLASDPQAPAGLELRCIALDPAGHPVSTLRATTPFADCWMLAAGSYRIEWNYASGAPQSVTVEVPTTGALRLPLAPGDAKGSSGR